MEIEEDKALKKVKVTKKANWWAIVKDHLELRHKI